MVIIFSTKPRPQTARRSSAKHSERRWNMPRATAFLASGRERHRLHGVVIDGRDVPPARRIEHQLNDDMGQCVQQPVDVFQTEASHSSSDALISKATLCLGAAAVVALTTVVA
ncbi:hypothetical protein [Variovorax boronicumulans]|uniref:hypothetical protein n=1 Tax=Variovorax boronicumulans TaxID=436515 RepID=UPI00277F33BC|nr:hypothetical protein [Variovorax boronicumulans]MDQ0044270.1 hypothetical protein [Variovorax boronicumulans]